MEGKKPLRKTVKSPNHLWESCELFAITGFSDKAGQKICVSMARNTAEPSEEESNVYRYQFATINFSPDVARKLAKSLISAADAMNSPSDEVQSKTDMDE